MDPPMFLISVEPPTFEECINLIIEDVIKEKKANDESDSLTNTLAQHFYIKYKGEEIPTKFQRDLYKKMLKLHLGIYFVFNYLIIFLKLFYFRASS